MIQTLAKEANHTLVERLERGAQLLFDLEQRGELGPEYQRWLLRWQELLSEYEQDDAA